MNSSGENSSIKDEPEVVRGVMPPLSQPDANSNYQSVAQLPPPQSSSTPTPQVQ